MSNEQNKEETKDPNHKLSNEEERKKQFERMKEKFGKQNTPFGGSGNKGGNNFYWIYGVVIVVLLSITFYGTGFSPRIKEISETAFEQDMLAKVDVIDINI